MQAHAKYCSQFLLPIHLYLRFLNLPFEQKISATLIDNTVFIIPFLKLISVKNFSKIYNLPSGKSINQPGISQKLTPSFETFLGKMRIAWTSQAQIYLECKEWSSEKMMGWFDEVSNEKMFELTQRNLNKESPEENLLWFNCSSFHSLEAWVVSELERSILKFYFNSLNRNNYKRIKDLQKHIIARQINPTSSCLRYLEMKISDITQACLLESSKYQEQISYFEESMHEQIQLEMIQNIEEKEKKKRKKRNYKKNKKGEDLVSKSPSNIDKQDVHELTQAQKTDCVVKNQEINEPKQADLQLAEEQSLDTHIKNQKLIFEATPIDCRLVQKDDFYEIPQIQKGRKPKAKLQRSYSPKESVTYDLKDSETISTFISASEENSDRIQQSKTQNGISETDQKDQKYQFLEFQETEGICSDKKRRRRHKNSQNGVVKEFKQKVFSCLINKQLTSFIDKLSIETNNLSDRKVVAFERVRFFVGNIFPMSQAILFGSNAVGLSLPSSDIDIMVFNIPSRSREQVNECLAQIAILINAMGWIVSCSTYLNAKVPLVKLEIDPSISYCATKRKSDYVEVIDPRLSYYLDIKDHDPRKKVNIKVDLTINLEEGCTISQSTELMRNWISESPPMQRTIIAMKYILANKGFNENFKGGIGSYCLFVMVAAYFSQFANIHQLQEGEILLSMLKFYGEQFENQTQSVTLCKDGGGSCFIASEESIKKTQFSEELLASNLLKIVDPLSGKIMSSSCYQYNNIKAEFRRIKNEILSLEGLVEKEIELCFTNNAEIMKMLTNKKTFDKWINKFEARSGFSILNIINGEQR